MTSLHVDDLFTAAFKPATLYLIYGEDKVGKTTLVLSAASKLMERGERVLWVDCGARLYLPRVKQLVKPDKLDMMYVAQPRSFRQQLESITNIHDHLPKDTRLVVCDDFTHLHRLELTGNVSKDLPLYEALTFQAALLKDLAASGNISVVVVGLVHEIPVLNVSAPVAGRIVSYWADCVVRLVRRNGVREAVEEKPAAGSRRFTLTDEGVQLLER
ncbi:MAG: hypothetical protein NZ570_03530 [Candidatus Caldarchaeum sp.]|nr:hypothetical protein [Candidatus Caldarchaeum sp.]